MMFALISKKTITFENERSLDDHTTQDRAKADDRLGDGVAILLTQLHQANLYHTQHKLNVHSKSSLQRSYIYVISLEPLNKQCTLEGKIDHIRVQLSYDIMEHHLHDGHLVTNFEPG